VRCGEDGTDCAVKHVVPALHGRCTKSRRVGRNQVPYEWRAACPVCHTAGKLTLTAKGRNLLRHCQKCKASQARLTEALAQLLPACFGGARKPGIDPAALAELALSGMPPISLKLALLEMAGMSTPEALDKLGVRRENRARVITGRIKTDAKPQVASRINSDDPSEAA
jgi:hypothetical protein